MHDFDCNYILCESMAVFHLCGHVLALGWLHTADLGIAADFGGNTVLYKSICLTVQKLQELLLCGEASSNCMSKTKLRTSFRASPY